jgi:NAD(P)-dependent dehydrogenase (short-subunit alcohol dehydrogenase family)
MTRTVLVTGCDRGLGLALTDWLAREGWRVFAGRYMADWPELTELAAAYPDQISIVDLDIGSDESVKAAAELVASRTDRLDMIVNNAAVTTLVRGTIREAQDYDEMMRVYNVNAIGALRVVEAFRPLMDRGGLKRLCFVSSEAGSINRCDRISWYAYCMSKTALNMGVSLLFNAMRPSGYTFRLFHPGWLRTYMSGKKGTEGDMEAHEVAPAAVAYFATDRTDLDENRLLLRDYRGREWPW